MLRARPTDRGRGAFDGLRRQPTNPEDATTSRSKEAQSAHQSPHRRWQSGIRQERQRVALAGEAERGPPRGEPDSRRHARPPAPTTAKRRVPPSRRRAGQLWTSVLGHSRANPASRFAAEDRPGRRMASRVSSFVCDRVRRMKCRTKTYPIMRRPRLTRSLLVAMLGLASTVAGAAVPGQRILRPGESASVPVPSAESGAARPRAAPDARWRGPATAGHHGVQAATGSVHPNRDGIAAAAWPSVVERRLAALQRELNREPLTREETPRAPGQGDDAALSRRLGAVLASRPAGTRVGVRVQSLASRKVVFDRNGDTTLHPASNQKLVTAVAAVELLGARYRFRTEVRATADTLFVVGTGDPSLQIVDLERLIRRALAAHDGREIRRIVLDDSAFSPRRFGPGYPTSGPAHSYAAPSSALALAFNTVEIEVRPSRHQARPVARTRPGCGGVKIVNRARSGRGGPLDIRSGVVDGQTRVTVRGTLPPGHAPVVARRRVHDPLAFFGACVARLAAEQTDGPAIPIDRGVAPQHAQLLAAHISAPLHEVLASALRFSNNFTSEQVLRTLAWRATGRPGTFADGVATVAAFWRTIGGDPAELQLDNGSGLSRTSRTTARALVRILALTQRPGAPSDTLREVMAVPGEDGTLRRRLRRLGPRLHAKTGTITGVSALSGIVTDPNGRDALAFSILVNGGRARDSRRLQDRMVLAMARHLEVSSSPPASKASSNTRVDAAPPTRPPSTASHPPTRHD
ncbi:MAG: D-alanyl-D-alanine carboxypeptidase/D-alanyl-D-alanine-endopeptidase [Myxococcales bacterium FL481]|nr:MAG: D-alanyl-D-alanine carboxypeptidase/D-alanyl-D-alanine-endopeptidase [Myxococcales bacterium FL481]